MIQGITQADQTVSYAAMAERQQKLAAIVLKDPDVAQPVLVHRRRRPERHAEFRPLPDQPEAARGAHRPAPPRSSARLQAATARSPGIRLYMQPVQDLTIDTAVERDAVPGHPGEPEPRRISRPGCRASSRRCEARRVLDGRGQRPPGAAGWPPTSPSTGPPPGATASRPATIDNALYDAFGQRIISTIFTQSNQYRVILEADPDLHKTIASLDHDLPAVLHGGHRPGAALGGGPGQRAAGAAADQPSRPVPGHHRVVQPRARRGARRGRRRRSRRRGQAIDLPPSFRVVPQGSVFAFQSALSQRALPGAGGDRHRLHRARRALRELHPPDHHPLDPAVGGHRGAARR